MNPSPMFHCSHDYHKQLPAETFELDLIDEEKLASLSVSYW